MTITTIRNIDDWTRFKQTASAGSQQPIAAVVRVGGSGTDILVSGLHEKPDHIKIHAGRDPDKADIANHSADLMVVKDILTSLAEQATNSVQSIMDVVFSVAGFATNADPVRAREFKQIPQNGEIYLPNGKANGVKGFNWKALNHMEEIRDRAQVSLHYRDDGMSVNDSSYSTTLRVSILNDTVAVAASAAKDLTEGEHAIGLVCGTGMNIGHCKDYNTSTGDFRVTENTEAGHSQLPLPKVGEDVFKYQSPLDLNYARTKGETLTLEETFAGDALPRAYKMLKAMLGDPAILKRTREQVLQHLNRYAPVDAKFDISDNDGENVLSINFDETSTINAELRAEIMPTNHKIEYRARSGDVLARALTLSLADRLSNTLIEKYGNEIKNPKTKVFAMTGSHLLHGILEVPGAQELFIDKLQDFRRNASPNSEPLKIVKHGRNDMDGLRDVLLGKIGVCNFLGA